MNEILGSASGKAMMLVMLAGALHWVSRSVFNDILLNEQPIRNSERNVTSEIISSVHCVFP
jgi:hypothetical protein